MSYQPPTDPPPYWQQPTGPQGPYQAAGPGEQHGTAPSQRNRLMFVLGGLAALMILGCIGLTALGIIVGDSKDTGAKELTSADSVASAAPAAPSASASSAVVTTAPATTVPPTTPPTTVPPTAKPSPTPPKPKTTTKAPVVRETTEAPAEPKLSVEQENAIESAESYLDTMSFSRTGLIKQLKYEGYSLKIATKAVDSLHVNFKQQAARSAASYLDSMSFSRTGLVKQLEYEGFTHDQAVYGVNQVM